MFRFLRPSREKTDRALRKTREAWFSRLLPRLGAGPDDAALWDEVEEALVSADVGVGTTQRLLERARERARREGGGPGAPLAALRQEMVATLDVAGDTSSLGVASPPMVVLMVGVNGSGKTTSAAKLAAAYLREGERVILGAADTFRAAGIEQLQEWGRRLGVDVIAHRPGADPAAVAFDTLQAARARGAAVAIVDTAGRLHTQANLMDELRRIQRVLARQGAAESQRVILTLDATTGQNGLEQARVFTEAVACDGVFLAKLDGTARGGIVLAIAAELRLPVLFVGTGESPDDMAPFSPREFVDALLQRPGPA